MSSTTGAREAMAEIKIRLTPSQRQELKKIGATEGMSESAMVRQAVARLLRDSRREEASDAKR